MPTRLLMASKSNSTSIVLLMSLTIFLAVTPVAFAQSDSLVKLADDFWKWRAQNAPFTGDDVNRMERPGGTRDWSRASIDQRRKDLAAFDARWKNIDNKSGTIVRQVDYRLI